MYTKGEWVTKTIKEDKIRYYGYEDGFIEIKSSLPELDDRPIATIPLHHHSLSEILANAHLIAAAPRMAKLLEYLVTNGWNAGVTEEAQEILSSLEGK